MPERIRREYRIASRFSAVGATLIYALGIYCLFTIVVFLAAFIFNPSGENNIRALWPIAFASHISITGSVFLLAEFLRHFRDTSSPFNKQQSARLTIAALLLVIRLLIDCIVPTFDSLSVATGITLVPQSGLDLKVVVMVVFLVCLAMVVRYGDALKEDSDAFV